MNRSSSTDPLRIATIAVNDDGGRLGLTLCPGKTQAAAVGGGWCRNLDADLEAVRAWGARAVVTLCEGDELAALGVADLGAAVEARGLDWYHLPIPDAGIPDERFEEAWCHAGLALRRALRSGHAVVLHCRGGLGRTGMISARLLIELGWPAEAAIAAVRAARPGAIETVAQADHVGACTPRDDVSADRFLGCLVGGAVGDAFGYEVEFSTSAEIRRRHGAAGLATPVLRDGRLVVSDDTQMTLFTLEGLLNAPLDASDDGWREAMRRAYLDWYATQQAGWAAPKKGGLLGFPEMWASRAPGNTCLAALSKGGRGTVARPLNDSKGCGGVMRTAPIGFLRGLDVGTCFRLGAEAAAVTHGHPSGYLPAAAMAALVRLLADGADLAGAVRRVQRLLPDWPGHGETSQALARALKLAQAPVPYRDVAALGAGWVGDEALAIGLYAALVGKDFAAAVAIAANHDGDSDSTASIAGQLYGAWHGVSAVPQAWARRLDVLPPLLWLARRFMTLR